MRCLCSPGKTLNPTRLKPKPYPSNVALKLLCVKSCLFKGKILLSQELLGYSAIQQLGNS